ncbi:helix-turn-helix domain-containing protein [Streptomyces sp. NPDC002215]|uniref:PucR family transcriptional regulator n=1 Tax=Streptomyces sp. NPDC002215 TaxID=3154412 RepID=UPI00332C04F8
MSELGADPASMMRIISYFDELGESAADADTVVRSAAVLAECSVGSRWPSGTVIRYGALGDPLDGRDTHGGPMMQDLEVWIERSGVDHALDPVLLDRLRHTLRMVDVTSASRADLRLGDPAMIEVILSDKERREDRVRAVELLGLDPGRDLRVLAIYAEDAGPVAELLERTCPARFVRSVTSGNLTVILMQAPFERRRLCDVLHAAIVAEHPASQRPSGGRGPWVGIGERVSVHAAPTSWIQARRALRFASSTVYGRRAVEFGRLGPLDLLADVPLERLLENRGVARINALAASASGAQDVDTLEAFCVYGSLRRTAAELHVHHSTVASRLTHVEAAMDWDLGDSIDRFTATLVLMLRRMALSSAESAASEAVGG